MNKLLSTALGTMLLASTGAEADFVINDDLIVTGSTCVGFDCTNGLSFGFDTHILKENNLRLFFDDTSTSASFPNNDWRLTANDTTNGGVSRFSIEDATAGRIPFTIRAGAPNNALYIDNGGRVGLGTSTPVVEMHITDGDTPTVRLDQNGNSGFTPQTWDVAGNETNFFIRDATNGSKLPFRIRPGAPTSSIDIAANGNVGMGTSNPATKLHLLGITGESNAVRLETTGTTIPKIWDIKVNKGTGRFTVTDDTTDIRVPFKIGPDSANDLLRVGIVATDRVDIKGSLFINNTQVGPDYVFTPAYQLLPIEAHAEQMWEQKHLPKLAPAQTNEAGESLIDVGARSHGTLEELEIAHIYIQQLNDRIKKLEEKLATLETNPTIVKK